MDPKDDSIAAFRAEVSGTDGSSAPFSRNTQLSITPLVLLFLGSIILLRLSEDGMRIATPFATPERYSRDTGKGESTARAETTG